MEKILAAYDALKSQSPDNTVVFVKAGDFYETFGEDAHVVGQVCVLRGASRNRADGTLILNVGVPYHLIGSCVQALAAAGHTRISYTSV